MSLKTWMAKYYPTDAKKVKTTREALKHSLRKWRGLYPGILKEHGLEKNTDIYSNICDEFNDLAIDVSTCALCHKFLGYDPENEAPPEHQRCTKCPLKIISGYRCDDHDYRMYQKWSEGGDPKPMVKLLEKALRKLSKKRKAKKKEDSNGH